MSQSSFAQPHIPSMLWALPICQMAWQITPPVVQDYIQDLHKQIDRLQKEVERLQGRTEKTSQNSSKPPSSDSPFKKAKRKRRKSTGKRGARKGHPGKGPTLLSPTQEHPLEPDPCACGHGQLTSLTPYQTHQVIELPPIDMEIHHFILYQGQCSGCGRQLKAQLPQERQTGYGPRLSALIGELSGMHRTSRRLVQDFCQSVLNMPICLGTIQKIIDRTSQSILPHYQAIAELARQSPVGYIDETPWYVQNTLQWLWTLSTDTVSLYLIHPNRSKEAFETLIQDWQGILVSDGYGVYQNWVYGRQTCLAHLIRSARELSEKRDHDLAACGAWALKELQRLCHMAKEPPSGGQ